ncbi:MAG: hypothetical protein ACPGO7_00200 [Alphaproteobacteria bacterium]
MSRGSPTELENDVVALAFAVEMQLDDGPVRVWSQLGTVNIDGNTYYGVGTLLSVSNIEENADIVANGITILMSGIDSSDFTEETGLFNSVLNEDFQFKKVRIFLLAQKNDLTWDSYTLFGGIIDRMTIDDDGETSTISLGCESRLIELERPRHTRYTDNYQRYLHPERFLIDGTTAVEDTGLSKVSGIQDLQIEWK